MKFLLIATSLSSITNFRGKLLSEISKNGGEIFIILPDIFIGDSGLNRLQNNGYTVHFVPLLRTSISPVLDVKSIFNIYFKIKEIKPDIILSYTIKPVIYGSIAARLAGAKQIYSLITGLGYAFISLDDPNHKVTTLQNIVFKLYKIALSFCVKVFFQNSDDAALFHQMKLVNKDKTIIVNGSGVDLSHYTYDISILEEMSPNKPLVFLMLGRIIGDKGIREYVGAAKNIKKKYGDRVVFQLAGGLDSNPTAIKQDELDTWINEGSIEYLGKLKDVRPAITNSHVFVLPSYREGTSRSILEAMSIGRPIVTTNVPGCRQLLENGKNGFLAEAKSIESLEEALEKVIKLSTEELVRLGVHSRHIVEEKYDVDKVNAHMLREMGLN